MGYVFLLVALVVLGFTAYGFVVSVLDDTRHADREVAEKAEKLYERVMKRVRGGE